MIDDTTDNRAFRQVTKLYLTVRLREDVKMG
jgi:hypothetical protein